jgi:general secretion pathway protein E/type IV pilus assembly protein PilB
MGLFTTEQLEAVRAEAESREEGVVDTLLARKMIRVEDMIRARAMQFGLDMVDLTKARPTDEVLKAVPRHIAKRYKVIPVSLDDDNLVIALSDPGDLDKIDGLQRALSRDQIFYQVATDAQIDTALEKYYGYAEGAMERMVQELSQTQVDLTALEKTKVKTDVQIEDDDDAPLIRLVNNIIIDGFRQKCSDIHIEPMEQRLRVRYRIDGVLQEANSPPKRLQGAIVGRIKITAGMQISERRVPQDGRIQLTIDGKIIDFRVSCMPSSFGETIVMRILDKSGLRLGLSQLGFMADDQATFERCAAMPDGILLVTGPTGSGKTTTLYSCLNYINRPDKKIITVEDPVEYQLTGINQVQVNEAAGLTFSAALRSMLRQSPNIIMLGEIRDVETGSIAINASLTGHFVFSTLHTNDAPSAITRMIDIGIKPFLVASATRCILAQRLVRKFCQQCVGPHTPTDGELKSLGITEEQLKTANYQMGAGCKACGGKGYRGRFGIFEVFALDARAQRMVIDKCSVVELREYARKIGMNTLREDGVRKVLSGMTSTKEVVTATASDAH